MGSVYRRLGRICRTCEAPPAVAPTEQELFDRKSLDQLNAERPLNDVFFDYDQNTLREDGRQAPQADAQWLKKWSRTVVRVDGHCDERGTGEYNLALGDRRASVVKQYLVDIACISKLRSWKPRAKNSPNRTKNWPSRPKNYGSRRGAHAPE